MSKLNKALFKVLGLFLTVCLLLAAAPAAGLVWAASVPSARVLFTFDDGWKGQINNALPVLEAAGFKATAYVNSKTILGSSASFMRKADLKILYEKGWDIGNHTTTHESTQDTDPTTMEKLTYEYLNNQNWIIENVGARGARHIAYPSGLFVPDYLPILRGIGALTARTTVQVNQVTPIENPDTYYLLPIKSVSSKTADSIVRTKTAIDNAVRDGSTVILMLHDVLEVYGTTSPTTTIADLQSLVDYVKNYVDGGSLQVQTISEWYQDQIEARPLTPVTPPAPIVAVNDAIDTVIGLTPTMEYSLDGADYVSYVKSVFDNLNLTGNHQLAIRYKAVGINPAGPAETLVFTKDETEPAGRVIFTFDDGWKSQITYALPVLANAGFSAVAYVNRDSIIGTNPVEMRLSDLQILYNN
ncbi:MAG: polysaccharide deacetylase family protein, partial [Ruminococcaceae bacterium]|nr:polysaccharide deacetylase family protein [Oscillospiraceae bacterium]